MFYFFHDEWIEGCKERYIANAVVLRAEPQLPVTEYRIVVQTSDTKGAGTEADVYIRLFGLEGGATNRFLLMNGKRDTFERGCRDEFDVHGRDVGKVTKISVKLDSKTVEATWHPMLFEVREKGRTSLL